MYSNIRLYITIQILFLFKKLIVIYRHLAHQYSSVHYVWEGIETCSGTGGSSKQSCFSPILEIKLSDSHPKVITMCAILANGVLSMSHFKKGSWLA